MSHYMSLEDIEDSVKNLGHKEVAGVIYRLRKRVDGYKELHYEETGTLVGEMAKILDLNALQTGRLQVLTHQANERLKQALKEFDKDSSAIHPLDRIEGDG